MSIRLADIVSRSKNQVDSEIDGEVVMMSVQQGKYYGLDETGSRIWQLIEQPITVSEIIEILLSEYDDKKNTCEQDTMELLNELQKDELISVINE